MQILRLIFYFLCLFLFFLNFSALYLSAFENAQQSAVTVTPIKHPMNNPITNISISVSHLSVLRLLFVITYYKDNKKAVCVYAGINPFDFVEKIKEIETNNPDWYYSPDDYDE